LIRERWEAFVGTETTAVFALPHLAGFVEPGSAPVRARGAVTGPAVIGSSTFAPRGLAPALPNEAVRLVCGGVTVGWGIPAGAKWDGPAPVARSVEVPGVVLHGVHGLLPVLEPLLREDLGAMLPGSDGIPTGAVVLGDPNLLAVTEGLIEPGVVFDTRPGPIVLESGVEVRSGSRLEGPLWAGANARILGGAVRASAIGPRCTVRGEISTCVFLGYANKAHDGFLGHSVVGRWANLGAGTTTSNLKNTYGAVRLDVGGHAIDTGQMNVGSLIGDHAKTAIGTLLSTGTVIGAGANVFDAVRPPKYVAPFAWGGDGDARTTRDGFLRVAERVLPRRDVPVDDATRAFLGRVYDWAIRP
jgi:UDP-N-acetylglucosamine diphosphorylase/glucosamine-1-phosphate N-acetyltransferase